VKIRIELEIPVASGDLSPILEAAQAFARQLAADLADIEIECQCGDDALGPETECPKCDGTGVIERDYDNEMTPESQKVVDSVSVEEVRGA